MKKTAFILGTLGLALVSTPPALADYTGPKLKFRLAHTAPPGNHITMAYQKFADLVKEKSDGKMQVQVFPAAILGSDRVLIEGAQKGTLEIGVSSTPNLANFSPLYAVFDLPYITSPKFQQNLYKSIDPGGELNTYFKKVANDIGMEPVMYAEYGYRNFVSVNRPLKKAADLKGMKMRTTDSPVEVDVAKALGTNPAPIAWGEVYTALQQGTIDAQGNTFPHLFGAKHNEVLKYAITSNHNYGMQVAMANKKWWDGLAPESQAVIREAAAEALAMQRTKFYPENEKAARKAFVDGGISIHETTDDEIADFKKTTKPVFDAHAAKLPPELVKMVQDTQR
ncbi:TRAP transporter substrate-binding protein [Parapusillimonas granuli]|uniref:TRAP transporter substrate-binding protein n=1 Tax=Parapusillimonas granuli TaxID=380911 RepID=A0A853G084_9BURK|nr:TRAP transporter substrate-binding protein [Parapusillimonas granuli]MBB5213632.1 tripartite ATP-independent transporter DctP family solute receptor [Parapusillimonas granuli]MEB2398725.1 TRAP transporter substrate-binding protein [Alcaligenaceae bacterium]NYT48470.1 TRAP transporter substrate-binding protein [Parapusillimonas granuli]